MRNDWLTTHRNAAHLTQALGLLAEVAQFATWLLLRVDVVAWAGSNCGVGKLFGMEGWKGSPNANPNYAPTKFVIVTETAIN